MWQLYAEYYDNVEHEIFQRDLAEKDVVFLGTDGGTGQIVGFSTARFFLHRHAGRAAGVFFSGDTVFEPWYWGQTALHRAVLASFLTWKLRHPLTPLYWYLLCSGFRTYLILIRNWPTHWPHHERPTPDWEHGFIHSVGRQRYGDGWDPERGVLCMGKPQPVLKSGVAPASSELLALPEVAFFVQANPGHAEGDELAVVGRVDFKGVSRILAKWAKRALRPAFRVGATP
jgi:hypothetical protein